MTTEDDHAEAIDVERRRIQNAMRGLADSGTTIRQSLARLDDRRGALYDVELVETRALAVARNAMDQIELALAALSAVVPKPSA